MVIFGWIVWAIAAATAFGFISFMRADAKKEQPIHILQVFQVVLMLFSVMAFIFAPWNKLNLIWVMPAVFVSSFLGFIFFRVPIIGTLLRVITLSFARVFFIGTGANLYRNRRESYGRPRRKMKPLAHCAASTFSRITPYETSGPVGRPVAAVLAIRPSRNTATAAENLALRPVIRNTVRNGFGNTEHGRWVPQHEGASLDLVAEPAPRQLLSYVGAVTA